jgi:hypothetical protein
VKQGWYTLDENSPEDLPMRTFVGSPFWRDYSVEMDVINGNYWTNRFTVFLRVQNEDEMVGFFIASGGVGSAGFAIRKGGEWEGVEPGGRAPNTRNFHLLITVKGDTYSAYANDVLIITAKIPGLSRGYVGLQTANWGKYLVAFDNFKVTRR